jgi:hypothetical protein
MPYIKNLFGNLAFWVCEAVAIKMLFDGYFCYAIAFGLGFPVAFIMIRWYDHRNPREQRKNYRYYMAPFRGEDHLIRVTLNASFCVAMNLRNGDVIAVDDDFRRKIEVTKLPLSDEEIERCREVAIHNLGIQVRAVENF